MKRRREGRAWGWSGLTPSRWFGRAREGVRTKRLELKPLHLGTLLALVFFSVRAAAAGAPFDFESLRARAQSLALRAYVAPADQSPDWLRQLTYDDYRIIEFNAARSLWRAEKLPFEAQFFHPGNLYTRGVQVHELHDGHAASIPFHADYFNYRSLKTGPLPDTLGFAGVRLHHPLNHAGDELGVFLGASYFRFLCQRAAYGLSARGIAIDTAESGPEEFPAFTEFWLERPAADAKRIVVFALLDGPSVTGAYRFEITPGAETTQHVRAALFFRKVPQRLGLAPLTSMFWRGENSGAPTEKDPRPEVHDSDGLLIALNNGERLWRPLTNSRAVRVSAFTAENPRGFGFLQRDRDFEHYRDREAHYDRRPSAWIQPVGDWGRGAVELVEIPTKDEYNDNVVAFWWPAASPKPNQPVELEYRIHWTIDGIFSAGGEAIATIIEKNADGRHATFHIDFQLPAPTEGPTPVVSSGGRNLPSVSIRSVGENRWRVTFPAELTDGGPLELRCVLRNRKGALTETWTYLWQP